MIRKYNSGGDAPGKIKSVTQYYLFHKMHKVWMIEKSGQNACNMSLSNKKKNQA